MLAGLDIGGTKTLVAVAGDDGRVIDERRLDTEAGRGGDQLVERVAAAIGELGRPRALGVAVVGPLRRSDGMLLDPPHLGWGEYPLRERLEAALHVPVVMDNDCNAGALGEHRAGAGRGSDTLVYFGVGTGVGGGIVLGGRLHRGASDNAGELGHLVVQLDAPPQPHGWQGHLEAFSSGTGLALRAGRPAAEVAEHAAEVWRDGILALAAGVASMLDALSPDVVVLGGGLTRHAGPAYVDAVAARARELAFAPNARAARIVAAELGERSALVGALVLAGEHGDERADCCVTPSA